MSYGLSLIRICRGGLIEGRCASVTNGRRRAKFGARLRGGEALAVSSFAVVRRSSARTQRYRPATALTGMAWLAVKTHSAHIAIRSVRVLDLQFCLEKFEGRDLTGLALDDRVGEPDRFRVRT